MGNKHVTQTESKLKVVVLSMLSAEPFSKITVTEICQRASISKSTFYAHFFDKYELADQMISDYVIKFKKYIHDRFLSISTGTSLDILKQVILEIIKDSKQLVQLTKIDGIEKPIDVQLRTVLFEESFSFFQERQNKLHFSSEFLAKMYTNFAIASIMMAIEDKDQSSLISEQVAFMNLLQSTLLDKV